MFKKLFCRRPSQYRQRQRKRASAALLGIGAGTKTQNEIFGKQLTKNAHFLAKDGGCVFKPNYLQSTERRNFLFRLFSLMGTAQQKDERSARGTGCRRRSSGRLCCRTDGRRIAAVLAADAACRAEFAPLPSSTAMFISCPRQPCPKTGKRSAHKSLFW